MLTVLIVWLTAIHSMSRCTFKWTTKLFFLLLVLTVINSCLLLSSCGDKYTHRYFKLLLVRNFAPPPDWLEDQMQAQKMFCDLRVAITNPGQRNQPPNCAAVCSSHGQVKGTVYNCARCDVGLCMVPCFAEYHTKVKL